MDKILSISSLFISLLTLGFTCYVYTQIAKQQIQSKQIDVVTELVEYIHNTHIQITISAENEGDKTRSINRFGLTLFEIANYNLDDYGNINLDSMPIYFKNDEKYPIFFNSYLNNPLLPKEIADVLRSFYSYDIGVCINENLNTKSYVVFSNLDFLESQTEISRVEKTQQLYYIFRDAPAYENLGEFQKYSRLLKKKITEWYDRQGIDDINIREEDYLKY